MPIKRTYTYTAGGKTYEIPEKERNAFEKDFPDASIRMYGGGKTYDIPLGDVDEFIGDFPDGSFDVKEEVDEGVIGKMRDKVSNTLASARATGEEAKMEQEEAAQPEPAVTDVKPSVTGKDHLVVNPISKESDRPQPTEQQPMQLQRDPAAELGLMRAANRYAPEPPKTGIAGAMERIRENQEVEAALNSDAGEDYEYQGMFGKPGIRMSTATPMTDEEKAEANDREYQDMLVRKHTAVAEEREEPTIFDTIWKSVGSGIARTGAGLIDAYNGLFDGFNMGPTATFSPVGIASLIGDLVRGKYIVDPSNPNNFFRVRSYEEMLNENSDPVTRLSTFLNDTADRWSQEAQPRSGKGFVDMIMDGDFGGLLQKGAAVSGESLLMTLSAYNPYTMLANAIAMAGTNYRQNTLDNPDVPEILRKVQAIGSAAIEQAVEKYSDPVFKYIGGSKGTKQAVEEVTQKATNDLAKRILSTLGNLAKDAAGEGTEEIVSNVGNDALGQILDWFSGREDYGMKAQYEEAKKQNPNLTAWQFSLGKAKECVDAFIGGALAGVNTSAPVQVTTSIASGIQASEEENRRFRKADGMARMLIGEGRWNTIKQSTDEVSDYDVEAAVRDIVNNADMNDAEKHVALGYLREKAWIQGSDIKSVNDAIALVDTRGDVAAAMAKGHQTGAHALLSQDGDPHKVQYDASAAAAGIDDALRVAIDRMIASNSTPEQIADLILQLPEDQREGAMTYIEARSSLYGMQDAANDDVQKLVASEREAIAPNIQETTDDEGNVHKTFTTVNYNGQMVYVRNYDPSSPYIHIVDPETGEVRQIIRRQDDTIDDSSIQTYEYDQYMSDFERRTEEAIGQELEGRMAHNRKTNLQMEQGSLINSENGQMYVFSNDGETVQLLPTKANAETNQIEPVSGQPITMKVDDAVAMQDAYNDEVDYGVPQAEAEEAPVEEAPQEELEEAPVEEAAPVPANAETAVADIRTQMDNAGLSEAADAIDQGHIPSMAGMTEEQQGLALRYMDAVNALAEENARRAETQTAAAEPAKPTIPVDKKTGVKLYEQGVELDDAIEDIKKDGFTVSEVADISIAEAQKELEKVQKKVDKGAQTREELYDSRSDNPKTEYGKSLKRAKELQGVIDYYTRLKAREEELGKPAQEELENVAKAAAEETLPKAVEETHEEVASEQPAAETETAAPVEETQEETKDPLIEAYEREQDTVDTEGGLVKNEVAENNLSPVWRKALHGLGRHLGRRVVVVSEEDAGRVLGDKASQGMYDSNTNTVYLNEAYIRNGEDMLAFVAGHEITHALKDDNPEVWKYFVDAVKDAMGEEAFNERVQKILDRYNSTIDRINEGGGLNGRKLRHLSRDGAEEEVCADWAGRNVMTDAEAAQRILDAAANAGADPKSLIKKVLDWINGMLESLKAALKRGENVSDSIDAFNTAKKIWQNMYNIATAKNNARKEAEAKRMEEEENIPKGVAEELASHGLTVSGGAVMSTEAKELKDKTGYETPNETTEEDATKFSIATMPNWIKSFSNGNGKLSKKRVKEITGVVDLWYQMAAADDAIHDYISYGKYPGGDLNKDGKGPLRKNVEYVYTFDLDTTCPRTFQYLNYVDAIEAQLGRPMSQREMIILIESMRAMGQQIPCTYCYAENKRQALKQYYLNFIGYRNNVLSAKSDEEAKKAMYGLNSKGEMSEAAQKVFERWRGNDPLNSYRPSISQLVSHYNQARNIVLSDLDMLYEANAVNPDMSDAELTELMCERYRINQSTHAKAQAKSISEIINEWRYDTIEGTPHKNFTEMSGMHDFNLNALALWDEMRKYGASASSAKNVVKYYPYTDELQGISKKDRDYINGMGGLRMHSTNDFRIDYVGDYFQLLADMAKGGWLGHTYTKNPDFVRIFGNTGYRINMSIAAYDIDGKVEMNQEEGFNWEEVRKLREQFPNAGTMFMTTSRNQLQYALDADWVDMIIPFHASGLPKEVWYNMRKWEDATRVQNESFFNSKDKKDRLQAKGVDIPKGASAEEIDKLYDKTFKPIKLYDNTAEMKYELKEAGQKVSQGISYDELKKQYIDYFGHPCKAKGKRIRPHFLPGETKVGGNTIPGWHVKGETEAQGTKRYLELCEQYGVRPRFYGVKVNDKDGNEIDVTEHPNYVKLIKETSRMDTEQTPIEFNLDKPNPALDEWMAGKNESTGESWTPMEYAMAKLREFAQQGGYSNLKEDPYGVVDDFMKNVVDYERETGKQRPLDYISPDARMMWNIIRKGAEAAAMSEEELMGDVPYHPADNAEPRLSLSTEIEAQYPNWMDNQTPEVEGKRGQNTQVAGTVGTYKKVGKWIGDNLGKDAKILDASSGLGLGTLELRKQGFDVEDIEPYPGKGRDEQPTYGGLGAYQRAMDDGKQYDYIISNAVLNVIPDDWRNGVLHDMATLLKEGGKMFINTRKAGEEKTIKNKIELESPQEVLVGTPDKITSYQRFFTPQELKKYVQDELGEGYTVTIANEKNSGTKGLAAVVVTKESPDGKKKTIQDLLGTESAPEPKFSLGVPYQGSKNRVAKKIVDKLPSGKRFVDLFSGGGAVTHAAMLSGKYGQYRMNDINPVGQDLFMQGVRGEWRDYDKDSMTDEEFDKIKGTPEALPWSYNGLGRNLAKNKDDRNKAQEQIRRVKSLESLKEYADDVETSADDYRNVKVQDGDVVYADIPYEGTDQLAYRNGTFDKQEFVDWAQAQDFPIYVSEYSMPDGWVEVASFDVPGMRGGSRKEKLFVQEKFSEGKPKKKATTIQDILGTNKEEPRFSLRGEVGAANDPDAMANLSVAKDMDKEKRSAKSIWLATGWEKGADGKWRNEIPDVKAKPLDFDNVETIEDIVDAPELFAAYPQLKDYKVQFTKMKNAGSINHDDKLIKLDKDYNTDYSLSDEDQKELNERTMDYIRNGNWRGEGDIVRFKKNWIKKHGVPHIDKEGIKTIAHELQHAVQGIEGFARGGSVSGMAYEYLKELAEKDPELSTFAKEFADFMSVNDMMRSGKKAIANWLSRDDMDADDETKANLKKVADSMRDMSDAEFVDYIVKAKQLAKQARKVGEERYDRLAGEIEAKNVEDRLDMTDEERRSTPPSETEDLSRENQVVRFSISEEEETEYDKAVKDGDIEKAGEIWRDVVAKAMPNTKVLDEDGKPLVMSHHTDAQPFNKFDRSKIGTGQGQAFLGLGFNFSRGRGDSTYGSRNVQAYLNAENPLRSDKSTLSKADIRSIIEELNKKNGVDRIEDSWGSMRDAVDSMYDLGDDLGVYATIGMTYSGDRQDVMESFEKRGFDSTIEYYDDGRIHNAVVFNSNQIKLADPITYDDDNNPIPLEQRANMSDDDIRFSLADDEQSKEIFDASKKLFGTTYDIREAGYVLPDGSMLDFSGRNTLDEGADASDLKGRRSLDHRDIKQIAYEKDGNTKTGVETDMPDFIRRGAIRIDDNAGNINLSNKPTTGQKEILRRLIARNDGYVQVDFGDGWDSEHYVEYNGDKPSKVLSDIDKYYDEGIKPQPRFSISDIPFYSNAEKAVDGIKQEKATPEQWLKMIEKAGGLKAGEDKWMGLSDRLKGSDKKSLTKQEVMDFIRENQIKIEEVKYSDKGSQDPTLRYEEEFRGLIAEAPDEVVEEGDEEQWAWEQMIDQYGEDFGKAFDYDGDNIFARTDETGDNYLYPELVKKYWGDRAINSTRLNYTTKGLKNKKEIALVVPTIEPYNESDDIHFGDAGEGRAVAWVRFGDTYIYEPSKALQDEYNYAVELCNKYGIEVSDNVDKKSTTVTISDELVDKMSNEELAHWQELSKDVNNSIDKGKKRVLVIDEIQSKRHQEGREKGYNVKNIYSQSTIGEYKTIKDGEDTWEEADIISPNGMVIGKMVKDQYGYSAGDNNNTHVTSQRKTEQEALEAMDNAFTKEGVPDAPFEKNWHELAMKRMLRYAAENGYDKIAWTTGAQQAERYNISKVVRSVRNSSTVMGAPNWYTLVPQNSSQVRFHVGKDGKIDKVNASGYGSILDHTLSEVFGKDAAAKIEALKDTESIDFENQRIGGEGMKGFYDDMLPRFMDKYGKKWGVKTGEVELPNVEEAGRKMWAVDVTPEMKESVMQGQPMFSLADEDRTAVESYDAGEPTFVERITNSLLEFQNRNEESTVARMNAISSIGARLSDINKAMRAQKEYDKGTVDSLVRLAKMLLAQTKTMLEPDEQVKIWNALAKVVGKKDTTQEANKIVDVLVDSELRTLEGLLDKIRETKGVKLNSSGVETMGRLDIIGQRLVNAFNDGLEMKEDVLQNRIAETNMRLYEAESSTERESIDAELRGLELAQRYHEEIGGAKSTISDISRDISTAREDPESVGISKGKERAGYIRELQQRIRDEKISAIHALASIVADLSEEVKAGKTRAKMMRDEDLARKQEIWHDANSDLLGVPNDSGAHKKTVKEKWAENRFLRLALQPLATFNEMLRFFGESTVRGEGRLFNRFMPQFIWASDREWRRMKENRRVIDEKLSDIMGKKTEWSDLYRMESKMPTVPVTVKEDKEEKTYDLTQGNLLYIYMANKMTDGKVKLRKMGISEEDVEALKEKIDPRFIELADWIQSEFLPSKRKEFNEVHERMYGAPMADIEDYFPLEIDKNARASNFDVKVGNSNEHKPSTVTGSIIKRTFNTVALDITRADAFDVLYNHLQKMEHWAAFAEFSRDLNTLINYPNFKKKVKNMSSLRYGNGKQILKTFEKVAQIASGSYTPTVDRGSLDSLAVNIGKGVTMSKISFRLFTAMKQLLSAPAYISEASPASLAKYGTPVMWASNFNWAIENVPGFSKRWESRQAGDYRLKRDDLDWTIWNTRLVDKLSEWGMTPNAFVDAMAVAMGARAIYETNYKRMLKDGYDRDIARQRALEKATSYNETQQSSENAYLAPIQVDRTAASVAVTVFRNASMGYERRLVRAVVDLRNKMKSGYKDRAVEQIMKQAMKDGLNEEQARKSAERIYDRSRWRDIADVAIFGYGLQFLWNLGPYIVDLLFGDDDDKEKALKDAAVHALFGPIEGLTGGNIVSDGINNIINGEWYKVLNSSAGQMPIVSDIKKVLQDLQKDEYAAIVDIVHLLMSSTVGVNPANVSDWTAAIMDAGKGLAGEDGDNLEASEELTLLLLRLAEVPKSQTDKFFLDRVFGESPRDVDPERIDAMLKRYTDYKRNSTEFLLRPVRDLSDEGREKIEDKWVKRFETERKERMKALANEDDAALIEKYEKEIRSDLIKKGKDDRTAEEDDLYDTYNEYKRYFKKGTDESERPQSSVDSISRVLAGLIEKYIADNGEKE